MGNEIQIANQSKAVEVIDKDKVIHFLQTFGLAGELNQNEVAQFVEVAIAFQLNPFLREVYCIPYEGQGGRKLSIITGYEVYLKRAERIGDLNGWNVTTSGSVKDNTLSAKVTIYRKSWKEPFVHEVYFAEYNQNNKIWREKPITMIKKVAIASGFRMAFPDHFGGMPYTSDELPDNMTTATVTHSEPSKPMRKSEVEKVENAVVVDDIKAEQEAKEKEEIARKVAEQKAKLSEYNIKSASEVKSEVKRDSEGFAATPASQDPSLVTLHGHVASYKAKEGKKPHSFYIDSTWAATYDDNIAETLNTKREALVDVEVVCFKTVKTVNGKTYENLMIKELVSRD